MFNLMLYFVSARMEKVLHMTLFYTKYPCMGSKDSLHVKVKGIQMLGEGGGLKITCQYMFIR